MLERIREARVDENRLSATYRVFEEGTDVIDRIRRVGHARGPCPRDSASLRLLHRLTAADGQALAERRGIGQSARNPTFPPRPLLAETDETALEPQGGMGERSRVWLGRMSRGGRHPRGG